MSFPVALFLNLIFSAFFIASDRRRSSGASTATWLPIIWFMLAISKPLYYWFSPSVVYASVGLDYAQGSPIDRAVLSFLMAIALLVLLKRRLDWRGLLGRNTALLVVFAFLALSITWSGYSRVALKRLLRALGDVLMALIIITDPSPLNAIKMMIKRAAFILLPLSIVLIKYFRILGVAYTWDGEEMWVGVASQKNSLGILSTVIGVFFTTELINTWRKMIPPGERFTQLLFLGLSLYLLIGSRSATSLVCFIIGVAVYVLSFTQRANSSSIGRLYLILLFGSVILYLTMLEPLVAALGRDMTFTSRTFIWEDLLEVGKRHPILGVGYGSLWIGKLGNELMTKLGVNQAHNGYIEIYLQLGMVGIFFTVLMIVQAYRNIRETINVSFMYGIFRMTYLVMTIISNVTESSLLRSTDILWILFLVTTIQPPDSSLGKSTASIAMRTTE